MVSGRKSDRNRKNIVFGKIPQKFWWSKKIFGHRKFFDGRNFFDRHLEKISSPNKIFFDRKIFHRRKKMSTDFFDNHFSLSKNKFQTTFLWPHFYLQNPYWPLTYTHTPHAGLTGMATWRRHDRKKVSVTLGYELDDIEILGAHSPNSQNR